MDQLPKYLERLLLDTALRYPGIANSIQDIRSAYRLLEGSFGNGNKLLICGNGGSAADADHIVAELMKTLIQRTGLSKQLADKFTEFDAQNGTDLAKRLEPALPAISLSAHVSLISATSNDLEAQLVFA